MVVKYAGAFLDRGAKELLPLERAVTDDRRDLSNFFWVEPRDFYEEDICTRLQPELDRVYGQRPPHPFGEC